MRALLFVLLLTVSAWARTPEQVVREMYVAHQKFDDLRKLVQHVPRCFTPGFRDVILRAEAKPPGRDNGVWIDHDPLTLSVSGYNRFSVGKAALAGKDATVPLTVWRWERYTQSTPANERKEAPPLQGKVLLTDVGAGYQIRDVRFEGSRESAREFLLRVIQSGPR